MIKSAAILSYYSIYELHTQQRLSEIHDIIKEVLPNAEEVISYKMPAFKQKRFWYIMQDTKITLVFIQPLNQSNILKIS